MLFYGSAGVGKTCTKAIIAGDAPPDTRQSTPLATRPVTLYQVDAPKEIWKKFTSDSRMNLCARIAKSLQPKVHVQKAILAMNSLADIDDSSGALNVQTASDSQEMQELSIIHISEPTRRYAISYAVFCLKKKTT